LLIDQLALVDKARLEAKLEYQDLSSKYVAGQPQLTAVVNKLKTLDQQSAELKDKVAHLPSQQQTYCGSPAMSRSTTSCTSAC
jgi:tyrosine-protein kinase Etk/Wzc